MAQTNVQITKKPVGFFCNLFPSASEISAALPGLFSIVFPIAIVAELLWWFEIRSQHTWFVDIFIAAVLALVVANTFEIPERLKAGPAFAQKWFLRTGIIFYGLKFSFTYLLLVGMNGLIIVVVAVASAIFLSMIVGRLMGLDEKTSALIGAGTAICGIAATMATAPGIKSSEEQSGVAIGVILFWGTLALFIYPFIASVLGMPAAVYGTWAGATIHDLPQIIAAAQQGGGNDALKAALMIKMIRMAFIIVTVLGLNMYFAVRERRESGDTSSNVFYVALKAIPGFVIAFFVVVLLNTMVKIPIDIAGPLATYPATVTPFTFASLLLSMAIIGICCRVTHKTIRVAGMKAMVTGLIAWLVQSGLVLWLSYKCFS
jgi:uncharacterized integral membrane protein (TIGR00698 family)